jgi:hypothetical protein
MILSVYADFWSVFLEISKSYFLYIFVSCGFSKSKNVEMSH